MSETVLTEPRFVDAVPSRRGRHTGRAELVRAALAIVKQRPDTWAVIYESDEKNHCTSLASQFNFGAFGDRRHWAWTTRRDPDTLLYAVYVCYREPALSATRSEVAS